MNKTEAWLILPARLVFPPCSLLSDNFVDFHRLRLLDRAAKLYKTIPACMAGTGWCDIVPILFFHAMFRGIKSG
jgi:hypothetical protein